MGGGGWQKNGDSFFQTTRIKRFVQLIKYIYRKLKT